MSDTKTQLRIQARKHRNSIDPTSEDPQHATELFFDTIKPQKEHIIAAYYPIGREFDALHILEYALSKGFTCALPAIEKDSRILTFKKWNKETQMVQNRYNIPEPIDSVAVEPDIIIVPFLAFDRQGNRLGQGGGYYDATLAHYRDKKNIIAVGMGYSTQAVLFKLPCEEHDEKMDWVITPKHAHDFRGR